MNTFPQESQHRLVTTTVSATRPFSELKLVNGSTGDPVLYLDYPGKDNALLFDAGDLANLSTKQLADLEAVFLSHFHLDHCTDLDRIIRANLDSDKTLSIFGPEKTIERFTARLQSYEIQFFPFQQVVFRLHELTADHMRTTELACANQFARNEVQEQSWKSRIFDNGSLTVDATLVDHTVPCLAYAMKETTGYHPDSRKLRDGVLKSGPWINETLAMLRSGADGEQTLEIQGGRFTLQVLADQYFTISRGKKVVFVTDTCWSKASRSNLVKLASRAHRLYCDAYYAKAQRQSARRHKHMLAVHAAELARAAEVRQLVLMHFAPRYAGRYDTLVDEARAVFPNTSAE